MNTGSLFALWPVAFAGVIGALVPRRDSRLERGAIGIIAALLALLVVFALSGGSEAGEPPSEWPHLLNVLIAAPLAAGVVVLFLPKDDPRWAQGFTLLVLLAELLVSLRLLAVPMGGGWHFVYVHDWMPKLGIRYHVAVDGLSVWIVLLTMLTTPIAAYVAFGSIKTRIKELCFSFLLLQAAMVGALVALDLFLFYVFWELMLVPMYLLIGIWGGPEKIRAAVKFFLYTMTGSVLMLAGLLYLVWQYTKLTGSPSFDYLALSRVVLPHHAQVWCFAAFALAFVIKVPMFPVHTWLPDAHVQAPTAGSVILAAILLKMGTYGYLRFAMGMFPGASGEFTANLAGVAVLGGVLYGALVAYKQSDIKRVVAYSSVAHLGFVMLGLASVTPSGLQGALLQMINHGIATGALFLLVGVVYDRRHTRDISEFGGLAKVMPIYAAAWVVITLGSIGVPGTGGFVGEFLVIMGTMTSPRLGVYAPWDALLAAFGVVLAAVYMLSLTQRMFFGPVTNEKNRQLPDLDVRETIALAPLLLLVFVVGFFPSILLNRSKDAVDAFCTRYQQGYLQMAKVKDVPILMPPFDPAHERGAPDTPNTPNTPNTRDARTEDAPSALEAN